MMLDRLEDFFEVNDVDGESADYVRLLVNKVGRLIAINNTRPSMITLPS